MRYIVTIITALILAWASVATAQNRQEVPERNPQSKFAIKKVDFDHVREVITNPKNAYYYPKLMKAYTS